MSRFENDQTGVIVTVADSKDERFASGWTKVAAKKAPAKKPADK
jgi:hypothetical protein